MKDLPEVHFSYGAVVGVLLGLLFCAGRASAQDVPTASATAVPNVRPLSIILIENCDSTPLSLFATMPDGTILMFDRHSGSIDMETLRAWAQSATGRVLSARMPCGATST